MRGMSSASSASEHSALGHPDSPKRRHSADFWPLSACSGGLLGTVTYSFGEQPPATCQLPQLDVVMPWNPGCIQYVSQAGRRREHYQTLVRSPACLVRRADLRAAPASPGWCSAPAGSSRGWWSDHTRAAASSAGSTSSETAPAADLGGAGRARDARRYAWRQLGLCLGRALLLPPQCRGRAASRPHHPDPHSPGGKNSRIGSRGRAWVFRAIVAHAPLLATSSPVR